MTQPAESPSPPEPGATGSLRPGTEVAHYRIRESLGAGGMGEVYLADDQRLGRSVALKFLHETFSADQEQRGRLLREARAASSLRSSNIAAIYDIAEADSALFIVMEYVEGEALSARLARGALPVREAVDVAAQVADALDEAHTRGIVHRDIKSSNLMIDGRGRVKVLDFGLAKTVDESGGDLGRTRSRVTSLGVVVGTFWYMSPEQARGREVDARSDLFSLGVVLYEMLAGRLPFDGETATDVIDRVLNYDPPPLARFNHDVSPSLEAIVRKALAKDRTYRYQSARDFYIDLRTTGRELESASGRFMMHASQINQLAAGLWAGASGPAEQAAAPAEKRVAVMTLSNVTGDASDEWIGIGIAETLTSDLKDVGGLAVVGRAQISEVIEAAQRANREGGEALALDVGRRLRATWVIEGGYQRLGPLIRLTTRLVDVASGGVTKSVKIDGAVADLFTLQDRLVRDLSEGLQVELTGAADAAVGAHTRSISAYEAHSRGTVALRVASRESLDRAIELFEAATADDPDYAQAWTSLGNALALKGGLLGRLEFVERGVEALRRALSLDPKQALARLWLGLALIGLGRPDEAEREIAEAVKLDPADDQALSTLGRVYWWGQGRLDDGVQAFERALRVNPNAGYAWSQLALLYTLQGEYDRAETAARRAVELQHDNRSGTDGVFMLGAHLRLGYVYYRLGRYDDAVKEYERELSFLATSEHALKDRTTIEAHQKLAAAFHRMGDTARADRAYRHGLGRYAVWQASAPADPSTAYYIAAMHALRGETDAAIPLLRMARERLPAITLVRARLDPDFDPIRQDPAFQAVLEGGAAGGTTSAV